jgi:uncharacterized damage-inducible protein DinB
MVTAGELYRSDRAEDPAQEVAVAYEKGPQLAGSRLEDADFSDARLHAVNFARVKITDGYFLGAEIWGDIEGLRLNGVDVAPLVVAEMERLSPERAMLRASDPEGFAQAWAMIEAHWAATVARASKLPEAKLHERVDDEWSFVETLRHLILASDCWLRRMVKGIERPYHPWALGGSWLEDRESWGIDPAADPSLAEVLSVRREHMDEVGSTISSLTGEELERTCVPPDTPGHPTRQHTVGQCLRVVLNEEWEHHRYAVRDLDLLESSAG